MCACVLYDSMLYSKQCRSCEKSNFKGSEYSLTPTCPIMPCIHLGIPRYLTRMYIPIAPTSPASE